MSMRKKHYEMIASAIKKEDCVFISSSKPEQWAKNNAILAIVDNLCEVFEMDNPQFNRTMFRQMALHYNNAEHDPRALQERANSVYEAARLNKHLKGE